MSQDKFHSELTPVIFFCRILPILQKLFLIILPFVLTLGEFTSAHAFMFKTFDEFPKNL